MEESNVLKSKKNKIIAGVIVVVVLVIAIFVVLFISSNSKKDEIKTKLNAFNQATTKVERLNVYKDFKSYKDKNSSFFISSDLDTAEKEMNKYFVSYYEEKINELKTDSEDRAVLKEKLDNLTNLEAELNDDKAIMKDLDSIAEQIATEIEATRVKISDLTTAFYENK